MSRQILRSQLIMFTFRQSTGSISSGRPQATGSGFPPSTLETGSTLPEDEW